MPSMVMEPLSTGHTPAMALSMVDLPAPLPPITVTKSPGLRVSERFCSAFFSFIVPGLKVLHILSSFSISTLPFHQAFPLRLRLPAILKELFRSACIWGTARNTATIMAVKSFRSFGSSLSHSIITITM